MLAGCPGTPGTRINPVRGGRLWIQRDASPARDGVPWLEEIPAQDTGWRTRTPKGWWRAYFASTTRRPEHGVWLRGATSPAASMARSSGSWALAPHVARLACQPTEAAAGDGVSVIALLAFVTVAAFGTWIPLAQMLPGVPQRSRTLRDRRQCYLRRDRSAGGRRLPGPWLAGLLVAAGRRRGTARRQLLRLRASEAIGIARAAGTWTPAAHLISRWWYLRLE